MAKITLSSMNGRGHGFFRELTSSKEEADALRKQITAEASTQMHNQAWTDVQAALITNYMERKLLENPLAQFFNVRRVNFEDELELRELENGIRVYYTSRGGYIKESQVESRTTRLGRDTMGWHVREHLDKLELNYGASLEDLMAFGSEAVDDEIARRMLSTIRQMSPTGGFNHVNAGGPLTELALSTAINSVVTGTTSRNADVAVIGTPGAVNSILGFSNFSESMKDEVNRTGFLGRWRGANIIRVTGKNLLSDNEVVVTTNGDKQLVLYGSPKTKLWDENTVDYRHFRWRQDHLFAMWNPESVSRITTA